MSNFDENDEFENNVQIFKNYSFISCDIDRIIEMHAFMQLIMRK